MQLYLGIACWPLGHGRWSKIPRGKYLWLPTRSPACPILQPCLLTFRTGLLLCALAVLTAPAWLPHVCWGGLHPFHRLAPAQPTREGCRQDLESAFLQNTLNFALCTFASTCRCVCLSYCVTDMAFDSVTLSLQFSCHQNSSLFPI